MVHSLLDAEQSAALEIEGAARSDASGLLAIKETLAVLALGEKHARKAEKFQQASRWLAENRHRFRGHWVALDGDQLLAASKSSKEVFAQIRDRVETPLVTKIDENEMPFGGW